MEASLGAVPRPRTRSNSQPSRPAAVVRTKPPLPPTPPPASSTGQRQNKGKGKDGPHVPVPRPSTAGPSEPTVTHGPLSPLSPSSLLARSSSLLVSSRQKLVGRRRRTTSLSASTPPIVVGLPTPPTSPAPVLVPVPVSAARPPEIPPRNPTRGSPRPSAGVGSVGVGARSTAGAGASSRSPVPAPTPSARIPTAVLTRKDANTNADVNTIPIPMHAPIRKRSSSAHRRASTSASPAAAPLPPSPPISQFHRPTSAHAHGRSPTTAAAAVPRPADAGLHPISSPPSHSKSSPYLPPVPKGSLSIPPKSSPLLPSKSSSPVLPPKPSPSLPPLPPHPAMVPQHRHPPEVHPHSHLHPPRARFSTADRAILEELRRGLDARQSQFVLKGGARHHAYARASAPYPRNYERVVIDHDVWETAFTRQLCGSLTFHVFDAPPTKVLDLGCGSGTWILECARIWRRCEFVGLDLVPLHPDLSHLRSNDLQRRITWLQANCLDGLPFPDEEFDYVHVKRLALGVPETRWDSLLEEIARVMKPGGALEIIEEDLFFPGRPRNDESGGDGRSSPASTERSSAASASASASSSSLPVIESPYISAQALRRQHPRSRSPAAPPAPSPSQVAIPRSPALARSPSPARPRVLQKQRAPSLPPPRRSTISIPVATGTGVPPSFVFPRPSAAAAPAGESHKSALPIEGKKLLISAEASAPVDVSKPVHAPRPRVAALVSPLKSPSSPPLPLPRPPSPPLKLTSPPPKPTSLTYHIPSPSHSPKPTSSPAAARAAPSLQSLFDAIGSTTHNRRRSWIRSRPSTSEGPYTKSSPDVARPADPARPAFIRSASNPAVPSAQAKAEDVDANGQGEHAQSRPAGFSSLAVHIPSASLFEGSDASPLLLTAENAVGRASDRPKTAESGVSSASRTESGVSSLEARLSTVESRTSDSEAKTGTVESKASDVELMDSRAEPGLKSELAEPHAESGTPSSPVVVPKPFVKPQDPHDHSLLEHIYNETHAERWINLAPLSLLANALPLYFKDVRTHPPIMFMFPPRASSAPHKPSYRSSPAKRATVNGFPPHSGGSDTLCLDSSDDDTPQDSRLTLNTQDASFERGRAVIPNVDAAVPSVPDGVIHGREILRETQPFVLLDGTAPGPALSSARPRRTQSPRHAADSHRRAPHDDSLVPNRLPNKTLAFDLQSLNLHLSTRVTEIVACREAMWEWVLRRREAGRGRQPRVERGVEPFEAELLGMTRVEFDALLRRFEMDMRDNVALDARLHGTFGWPHPTPSPRSSEQREYDQACARWDAYVRGLPPDAPEQRREIARRASPRLSRTIRVFCAWR